jgi:hypothetical protein
MGSDTDIIGKIIETGGTITVLAIFLRHLLEQNKELIRMNKEALQILKAEIRDCDSKNNMTNRRIDKLKLKLGNLERAMGKYGFKPSEVIDGIPEDDTQNKFYED